MNKSILISIQPQHVLNILNGKKTLELRKVIPSGFKGWVYIYCTKSKMLLQEDVLRVCTKESRYITDVKYLGGSRELLNGSVVARFWLGKMNNVYYPYHSDATGIYYHVSSEDRDKLCLKVDDIQRYGDGKLLYGWRIKKLEIFDEPLNLSDFCKNWYRGQFYIQELKKAPQSWMYVWRIEK